MNYQSLMQDYWQAWVNRDWSYVGDMMTDDFTFTSPRDDHIDKTRFKKECWDTLNTIDMPEFKIVGQDGDDIFVEYATKVDSEPIHNIEHMVFQDGKLKSIEVFFGLMSSKVTAQSDQ